MLSIFILIPSNFIKAQNASQVAWVSKFAVAGGVNSLYLFPDMSEINKQISNFGVGEFSENGNFTFGGSGFVYIKILDDVRIGGIGFGGSTKNEAVVNGFNREAKYSLGGGAFTIEYSIPMVRKIALSVGAMIGAGSIDLELYQNKGTFTWDGVFNDLGNSTDNYSRKIKNKFILISPTINLDVPFNRFLAVRVGAGYLLTLGNEWQIENELELKNVPKSINADSFYIQAGLYFGLFLF
ncbi:MAG: hypothetical protein KJ571_17500 [Bacteroidetes bacterium]|nr:hypothetical protein [Bacteroidota bacterium]